MTINAVKKEDDNKKEAEVKILAEAVATIVAVTFKASNIYENDA